MEPKKAARTKTYDTGWVEVDTEKRSSLSIYICDCVSSYTCEQYDSFKYKYCSYDNFAEMTVKYTTSGGERSEYFYGTNLTYRFYQYNMEKDYKNEI